MAEVLTRPRVTLEVLGPAPVVRPQPGEGCDYRLCGSIAELQAYLAPARTDRIAFGADWEASSLNTHLARPAGLSVAISDRTALYVPVGHLVAPVANLPIQEVLHALTEADAAGADSLWYNVAYDVELSWMSLGWEPQRWQEVWAGVFLVDANVLELGLKASALRFLGESMQELSALDTDWVRLSRREQATTSWRLPHLLPPEVVAPYGCDDAAKTRRLWFHPEVQAALQAQGVIYDLERRVSPVLRAGNRHGVYLDARRLRQLRDEVETRRAALQAAIWAQLGEPVTLSRKAYLGQKLLDLGIPILERTDTGLPTVNVKVLSAYQRAHPVVPLLIQYAQLTAQLENYVVKLLKAHAYFAAQPWAEGRVRFPFKHLGVPTGRMKCGSGDKGLAAYTKGYADVNAQSIPDVEKATTYLPNIRSAFVAPPEFVVVAIDYNQIELRGTANLSGEPLWLRAYQQGADLHVVNAQAIATIQEPGVIVTADDKRRRGGAKATGFALLYGGDAHTIARNAGIPLADAQKLLDAFFQSLPTLKRWIDQTIRHARATKRVQTYFGRVRKLDAFFTPEPPRPPKGTPKTTPASERWRRWFINDLRGQREAINSPVQGVAADLFKHAVTTVAPILSAAGPGLASPQVLWLHDEVVFYCHAQHVTRLVPQVVQAMEFAVPGWPVPLKADAEIGSRRLYLEAQRRKAVTEGNPTDLYDQQLAQPFPDTGEGSSWGELVPYATWVERFAPDALHSP
jgi:DNA polymerase-1